MKSVILTFVFIITCSGLHSQDPVSLLASIKNTFLTKNQKILILMELRNGNKVIDKTSYKFFQNHNKYFVQMDKVYYLKQRGIHVSLDEYSNEFVIAKSKAKEMEAQYIEKFELLDIKSADLWKIGKRKNEWYMYISAADKSKAPRAEIFFNNELKPTVIKLPFPELIEDNGKEVQADLYLNFDYNPIFSVPNLDDWLTNSSGRFKGKGKYNTYEVTYINE